MPRCIYKIINVVNNKFYVGSAVDFKKRKSRHIWRLKRGDHANKHLQAAWIKYGESAFAFCVVQLVEDPSEDLLSVENIWLKKYVGKPYCYNIAPDATAPQLGMSGEKNAMWGKTFIHTESAKLRIGAASKRRIQSQEEREKRKKTMLGHSICTTTRLKISKSLSGANNPNFGKPRSAEFIAKVSRRVVATDPQLRETMYPSILALRTALGVKPSTVNRALKSGLPLTRGPYTGWSFKPVDTPLTPCYNDQN